jgi:photosystem II stability/assembly factor-like uncharacterized protein
MRLAIVALIAFSVPASARHASSPMAFEETPAKGVFAVHRPGLAIAVQAGGVRVYARNEGEQWQMRFEGAKGVAKVRTEGVLPGRVNYLRGGDRGQWRRNLRSWRAVRYLGIYPGIDVAYYGNAGAIEYDLIVAPGADPGRIRLTFPGLRVAGVTTEGTLRIESSGVLLSQHRPIAYQDLRGERQIVPVAYRVTGSGTVGFEAPSYDRTRPLVIDPVLVYSTYLGGNADDAATAVASDPQGNVYIAGSTSSPDFPTTPDSYLPAFGAQYDVFVTKLTADGTLIYSTYLGGTQSGGAHALAADAYGNAYVAGAGTPALTPGALSIGNEFIVKLNAAGNSILYSARFPSPIRGAAADAAGELYITGEATSTFGVTFPITAGAFQQQPAGSSGYVAKLNPAGTRLRYCTYLGGGGGDYPKAIAADVAGNAYVTGYTYSLGFPTMNPIQAQLAYSGFFRTSDGQSWSPGAMPTGRTFTALALDPTDGSLYLGSTNGLLKSSDGGSSWTQIGLDGYSVVTIATSPHSPVNVLVSATKVGGSSGTVFMSTDGVSFRDTGAGSAPQTIAIDPLNPSVVYTSSFSLIQKSTDGGGHWVNLNQSVFFVVYGMAVDPRSSKLYVASDRGIMTSSNGGQTFQPLSNLATGTIPTLIVFDPHDSNTIYLSNYFAIYKSTDTGRTFVFNPAPASGTRTLAFDPNNPSALYAATAAGVFKSTDGAATWSPINTGITNTNIGAVVFDPASSNRLYAFAWAPSDVFVTKLNDTGTALIFSTYLGGLNSEIATGIAVDAGGNVFIGGNTNSTQFPTTANAPQQTNAGGYDGFVSEISPDGGSLLFSTYFGGSGNELVAGMAIDGAGNAAIVGNTSSSDMPVSPTAPQAKLSGSLDGFVAVVTPSAGSLRFVTYLGGSSVDYAQGVAASAPGRFCIAGMTSSVDYPVTRNALQPARNGFNEAFVSIIDINQ